MAHNPSSPRTARQLSELHSRLAEAEETLNAIRSGSVDALVVHTPHGEQLFTLKGADQTYRTLVECMNEGAVAVKQGIISYCNHHFAKMVRLPLEQIFGTSISERIQSPEFNALIRRMEKNRAERGTMEARLRVRDGAEIPVLLSASRFFSDGRTAVCLVVTDNTVRQEAEQVRRELSRSILNAQEQERQRVARDLHDSVNQLLSSVRYRLSSAEGEGPATPRNIRQARELIEKAINEVRLISRNLRPSELDDLGLIPAFRSLTNDFQKRSGIRLRFRGATASRPLPGEVEMTLYRIAQEALNNVEKHSRATQADLSLTFTAERAILTVRDNGKGFVPRTMLNGKRGWGLQNMKERAALLNGSFVVQSPAGKGSRLSIQIPLGPRKAGRPR